MGGGMESLVSSLLSNMEVCGGMYGGMVSLASPLLSNMEVWHTGEEAGLLKWKHCPA